MTSYTDALSMLTLLHRKSPKWKTKTIRTTAHLNNTYNGPASTHFSN